MKASPKGLICPRCGGSFERVCRPCTSGFTKLPAPKDMAAEERAAELELLLNIDEHWVCFYPDKFRLERICALTGKPHLASTQLIGPAAKQLIDDVRAGKIIPGNGKNGRNGH